MALRREVLRGYVLEELIAYLLRNNGYHLISNPAHDRAALSGGANGLRVRGRGAEHQADALGELTVPTPFMLPVRLFCEAKYLNHKVGLEVIRNALGVLNDVNEQFGSTGATTKAPMRRFQYRYSIFSASGFTSDAEAYALAQQISLIDLRGPAFGYLLQAADRVTDALRAWQQQEGALSTSAVRATLRTVLDTEDPYDSSISEGPPSLLSSISRAVGVEVQSRELWLGFPSAPYILALQPDDPVAFRRLITERVPPEARLEFRGRSEQNGSWALVMRDESEQEVVVRFGLPEAVDSWVLATGETEQLMAREIGRLLKSIVVFESSRAVELRFRPLRRRSETLTSTVPAELRSEVFQHEVNAPVNDAAQVPGRWTPNALRQLLALLNDEGWSQGEMIRQAMRQGGEITREQVLQFPEYQGRTRLTGITRPVVRLTRLLQARGDLEPDASVALEARYEGDGPDRGWARGFRVPPELLALDL